MDFYTNCQLFRGKLYIRGYKNGERYQQKQDCEPYLFIDTQDETEYLNLEGGPVGKIDFKSPKAARDFVETYKDVANFNIYGMTNSYNYPWMNDTYPGQIAFDPSTVVKASIDIEVYSGPTSHNPDLSGEFPDPMEAKYPVSAITVGSKGHYYVFSYKGFELPKVLKNKEFKIDPKDITHILCKSEKDMLRKYLRFWRHLDPDIVTGWNVKGFDIPYLVVRITDLLGENAMKKLSPWDMVHRKETNGKWGGVETTYTLVGIATIDYMDLYKKFRFKVQESYKLDHIAFVELGTKKLSYDEYGNLHRLCIQDYQKYVEYNIVDTWLIDKLEEKLNFIDQLLSIAYDAKINFEDVFGTVRPWDVIIHNYLMNDHLEDKRVVVPLSKPSELDDRIEGGYVKDPKIGMTRWIGSFDLTAMYPKIIEQFNISPETKRVPVDGDKTYYIKTDLIETVLKRKVDPQLLTHLKEKNLTMTCNGQTWSRDKLGVFPSIIKKMFEERIMYKGRMLEAKKAYLKDASITNRNEVAKNNNMQMAKKIMLNSLYGAAANQYFRFFSPEIAEGITMSGQMIIQWAEKAMNKYLCDLLGIEKDFIIAVDTDSIYVNLEPLVIHYGWDKLEIAETVEKIDQICKDTLSVVLKDCYEDLAKYLNVYENAMNMDREAIANKGIWTAKKRYVLNVYDMEGVRYDEPDLKIMGLEAIKSSTAQVNRDGIIGAIKVIMKEGTDENDLQAYIKDFKSEYFAMGPEQIAYPRGVNNIEKWINTSGHLDVIIGQDCKAYSPSSTLYISRTPIHVKAAINHNFLLERHNLKHIQPISSGDKIKFCELKMPNTLKDKVVGFDGMMPREFNLHKYINYDLMFEKGFIKPIKTLADTINWKTEKVATLDL